MHGFPLTLVRVKYQMHSRKRKFATEKEAKEFRTGAPMSVYLCPFCCMYHISSKAPNPVYEQQKWWVIWRAELGDDNVLSSTE
jgi:hypothetical protein